MSDATEALSAAWGDAAEPISVGWAPGRCTLVGEHVDYAGGVIVAIAIDLGIEVAARRAADQDFHVVSAGRHVERGDTEPQGDIGDRILAAVEALRRRGMAIPGLDVGVASTLPESAGLSSSAAITCATLVAALRLVGAHLSADELVAAALTAERDIVGIPCGPLDQLTVVHAPAGGAVVLDCASGTVATVAWPWRDVALVACATGEGHDVGGAGYRERRHQAEMALAALSTTSVQAVDLGAVAVLDEPLRRRARHMVTETQRAQAAADALRHGDAEQLGVLMTASHVSLRDDYEVSTAALDACVAAALPVPGCYGARLVGAGFGGTAIALVSEAGAHACAAAMAVAAGVDPVTSTWTFRPSAGVASCSPDVVRPRRARH